MLLGILNDILDFSKIEAGKLTLEAVPCTVEELVDNALMLLRERAQDKDIELLCDYDEPALLGEAGHFWGDPLRLGQILTNLLSNAVKFTQRGHVRLRVSAPQPSAGDNRRWLRFDVEDSGVGLSDEQLARLFQEFTQADGSTTRRFGGTGLGLTIARRLAELMGGRIEVSSQLGAGSCFSLCLPVQLAPVQSAAPLDAVQGLRGAGGGRPVGNPRQPAWPAAGLGSGPVSRRSGRSGGQWPAGPAAQPGCGIGGAALRPHPAGLGAAGHGWCAGAAAPARGQRARWAPGDGDLRLRLGQLASAGAQGRRQRLPAQTHRAGRAAPRAPAGLGRHRGTGCWGPPTNANPCWD
jgi:hypothetical protein